MLDLLPERIQWTLQALSCARYVVFDDKKYVQSLFHLPLPQNLPQCEYDLTRPDLPCVFCRQHGSVLGCIKTQAPPRQPTSLYQSTIQSNFPQRPENIPSYYPTSTSSPSPYGNNLFGSLGTLKCETCRSRRKKVSPLPSPLQFTTYSSANMNPQDRIFPVAFASEKTCLVAQKYSVHRRSLDSQRQRQQRLQCQ